MYEKIEDIIAKRGEPFYKFEPNGSFSDDDTLIFSIPKEIAVFELNLKGGRLDTFICYSTYDGVNWIVNTGERFVIRQLLKY